MNPQEINRRIAIACGWYVLPNGFPSELWEHPSGKRAYESDFNYHGDLNAMHEVENELDGDLCADYTEYLHRVVNATMGSMNHEDMCRFRSATAPQRAEAFLRTIGQWEEVE
jgi:hypothetical protein